MNNVLFCSVLHPVADAAAAARGCLHAGLFGASMHMHIHDYTKHHLPYYFFYLLLIKYEFMHLDEQFLSFFYFFPMQNRKINNFLLLFLAHILILFLRMNGHFKVTSM